MSENAANAAANEGPIFNVHKLYNKNISVEVPNAPACFKNETAPEISVQLANLATQIDDGLTEVALRLTVTAKVGDDVLYLVEIEQAGVFTIEGFSDEQRSHMEGAFCPNILFPYARETLDSMVLKAGFPPLTLAPVNFDLLYAQRLEQMQAEGNA
ncbi:protein-export chaperone SecB [Wohlfahrtiimonas chitiniclastica]|uniref:Protein-export protein SecB n=1 Tax=Wohlfahrtiimonas chitiniclastica TaxID=400946 RepID=A0A165HB68_9GAMM|nr:MULTISPECIES: protein-export chaperone SecB [Wohlfahrtiimonas]KZS23377.1 preprotein translocase subunit SecB [Wohlfahrtiimonas chitiniclastica]KZX37009.1 protein-export chaperone SecB [Wohlfahrtiimonas chitiniclastica]MBS7815440.1 protein-export chaperone SecB [Wohlfahrtiimonas chitiniclastica]MBS7817614.1 protein-export chaperone SecB [Wohlfahrtiimonas chitiniclastica]MBS7819502.1 protein-export chaperone SecB [Wohlfahrtiimonas chitiniclastica]